MRKLSEDDVQQHDREKGVQRERDELVDAESEEQTCTTRGPEQ